MEKLRFAPLVRVSTEKQAERGESLNTQRKQIISYVESIGGIIPDHCWQYSGQEHATPDQERVKLEQLLSDASKNIFDAVIVVDASRWSRDNGKSKRGLEILRDKGVKFFVGMMEYDLFLPEHILMLGMSAEIGEFQARQQSLKSTQNRIERAKQGIPSAGKLPPCRTFDKAKNEWGLDVEKAQKIRSAAERYLEGESMATISKSLGMNHSNLWKTLTERSGTEFPVKFDAPKLNIKETVIIKVPRLLPEETIEKIKKQAEANKTYQRGVIKHKYLLARFVFCKSCGYYPKASKHNPDKKKPFRHYTMTGQTNHNTKQYYRHYGKGNEVCTSKKKWVPAEQLETAVLLHIFSLFGDQKRIETALENARPDQEQEKKMWSELGEMKKRAKDLIKQSDKVVDLASKDLLSDEEITAKMTVIREAKKSTEDRIQVLETKLATIPHPDAIKKKAEMSRAIFKTVMHSKAALKTMTWEQKRELMEFAFAGKDEDGNRLGVFIEETGNEKRPFRFEIKCILDGLVKSSLLPMSTEQMAELLDIDGDYVDIDEAVSQYVTHLQNTLTNNTSFLQIEGFLVKSSTHHHQTPQVSETITEL